MKKLMMILSLMFTFNVNALADFISEMEALMALYHSTNGDNWTHNTNWGDFYPNYCYWYGITCDNDSHVVKLELSNNNLTGTIPSDIGNLTELWHLDLGVNNLTGEIPNSIGNLKKLKFLYLWGNKLTGSIPNSIGNLTKLLSLGISFNKLSGSIPSEIGNLTSLSSIILHKNNLTGTIPSEIGGLTGLRRLILNNNHLTGTIPSSITNLTNIIDDELDLYKNCSLKTNDQFVVEFINSIEGTNGYKHILETNGNCMNLSPIYYLLLD